MQLSPSQPLSLARVLLLPDALISGELRESFLDRASFLVRTALTAEDALSMAEVWRPTLVVFRSELGGPRVSEFCERLRTACPGNMPKLIMLTETCGAEQDDSFDAGCDCHLISPVDAAQLLDSIATLLAVTERRAPRVALDTLVQTRGFSDGDAASDPTLGTAIAVSEEGMLLECSRQLPVRSRGSLQFFLPGQGTRLTLQGSVQLVVDEIRQHYAIAFTDVDPEQRALLRGYVTESSAA